MFILQTLVSPSFQWPRISFSYFLPPMHLMPLTAKHLKALSHMEGLLKTAFGHSDCFHGCSLSVLIQKDLFLGIGLWGVSGAKVSGGLCVLTFGKQLTGWSCSVVMQPPKDAQLKDWPGPYGKQLFSEDRWQLGQGLLGSTRCCPENKPGSTPGTFRSWEGTSGAALLPQSCDPGDTSAGSQELEDTSLL